MLQVKIDAEGNSIQSLSDAVEKALWKLNHGCRSGMEDGSDSIYSFDVSGEEAPGESGNADKDNKDLHEEGGRHHVAD